MASVMGAEVVPMESTDAKQNKNGGVAVRLSGASRVEVKDHPAPILFSALISERPILGSFIKVSILLGFYIRGRQDVNEKIRIFLKK